MMGFCVKDSLRDEYDFVYIFIMSRTLSSRFWMDEVCRLNKWICLFTSFENKRGNWIEYSGVSAKAPWNYFLVRNMISLVQWLHQSCEEFFDHMARVENCCSKTLGCMSAVVPKTNFAFPPWQKDNVPFCPISFALIFVIILSRPLVIKNQLAAYVFL